MVLRRKSSDNIVEAEARAKTSLLGRRTFLQGTGVVVALPILESLLPRRARAATKAASPPIRLVTFYVPCGTLREDWIPSTTGANYQLSPTLQHLAAYKNDFAVISGTSNENVGNPGKGGHAIGTATWGTASPIAKASDPVRSAMSFDQLVASKVGNQTRIASMQLGCAEAPTNDAAYASTYNSTVSWASPTLPLKPETSVAKTFKKLFPEGQVSGTGANQALYTVSRAVAASPKKSILDGAVAQAKSLQKVLGTQDRAIVDQYLTAIRELERSIVHGSTEGDAPAGGEVPANNTSDWAANCPAPQTAAFSTDSNDYVTQASQFAKLIPLALQCDQTRVISFMMAPGESYRIYKHVGVNIQHHFASHYTTFTEGNLAQNEKKTALRKIYAYQMQCFAALLENMKKTQDASGSLLDNSVVMFGSEMSDSQSHSYEDMPVLLAGGASGRLRARGQHLRMPEKTPYAQVLLTAIRACGVEQPSFGSPASSSTLTGVL